MGRDDPRFVGRRRARRAFRRRARMVAQSDWLPMMMATGLESLARTSAVPENCCGIVEASGGGNGTGSSVARQAMMSGVSWSCSMPAGRAGRACASSAAASATGRSGRPPSGASIAASRSRCSWRSRSRSVSIPAALAVRQSVRHPARICQVTSRAHVHGRPPKPPLTIGRLRRTQGHVAAYGGNCGAAEKI